MTFAKSLAATLLAVLLASPAQAAFITSLYGTGLNADRTARTNNESELYYTTLAGSPVVGTPVVFTDAGGFPVATNWLADGTSASSRWIAPSTVRNHPPGDYTFRTTFDLAGYSPGTASLTGKWATDNAGLGIRLNGTLLAGTSNSFASYSTFSTSDGGLFVAGVNTLDFVVNNAPGDSGNPAGLRVEITGEADLVATPMPPTALLAVFALGAAAVARRRRD